jgi:hypothetical protein
VPTKIGLYFCSIIRLLRMQHGNENGYPESICRHYPKSISSRLGRFSVRVPLGLREKPILRRECEGTRAELPAISHSVTQRKYILGEAIVDIGFSVRRSTTRKQPLSARSRKRSSRKSDHKLPSLGVCRNKSEVKFHAPLSLRARERLSVTG